MIKRILICASAIILALAIPVTAIASTITNAQYKGTIQIINTSTASTNQIVAVNIATNNLIDSGFITDNCSNTAIRSNAGADVAYMPSTDNTTPWMVYVPSIGTSVTSNYYLYTGGTPMAAKLSYFPGNVGGVGMTVSDNASLEVGTNGIIRIDNAYINTSVTGVGQYLVRKGNGAGGYALRVYVSAAGTISAEQYGFGGPAAWTVSVAGITSGEYDIVITPGVAQITLAVGSTSNSVAYGGIVGSTDDWQFFGNNCITYAESCSITVNSVLKGYWPWQRGTLFYDKSGNGNTATPTFRTTGTSVNITVSLLDLSPISPASATGSATGSYATMVPAASDPGGTFDELTPGTFVGSSFINEMMAAGGAPNSIFWFPVGIIIVCVIGLIVGKFTQLLWLQTIVMCVVIGLLCTTIFPWWMVPVFGILGATTVVIDRAYL